jgi:pyruvate/2-oxoglutarate dehydrogenase complex dihydrolipoamide acyltransferase (E2) component
MSIDVLIPPLGQTVDAVRLIEWYRQEGQFVIQGEMLFAIETDKANLDIESPATGVLTLVSARPGDIVQVLSTIALISGTADETTAQPSQAAQFSATEDAIPPAHAVKRRDPLPRDRVFISPRALRLARKHVPSLVAISPSGPEGAIIERDVRAHLTALEHIALDIEGDRVVSSPLTVRGEISGAMLMELRDRLAEHGVHVSSTAVLLTVLGRAVRHHPFLSAALVDRGSGDLPGVHIGLAVRGERGLVLPVVRDVDCKGLIELDGEVDRLVRRAEAGECSDEDLSGASFVLLDLNSAGVDSPIGPSVPHTIPSLMVQRLAEGFGPDGALSPIVERISLTVTVDRRKADRSLVVRFMEHLADVLEHPCLLLA